VCVRFCLFRPRLFILGGIAQDISSSSYCNKYYRAWSSVCMYVCVSVTLMQPAKTVGWNEMPFGRGGVSE